MGHESASISKSSTARVWPTPQDYNEALQNPHTSFRDPELITAVAATDSLGLPRPNTGAFASVYKVTTGSKSFAIRCFLHNVRDQEKRYELISNFIMKDDLPYTVSFEYQREGILIRGEWFPILKMEWVEGQTLEQYMERNLNSPVKLQSLLSKFRIMFDELHEAGIAHGDLQHGNVMLNDDDELRLVDYDGVYVPGMEGWKSNELGHRNYQHPSRDATHFGPYLDTFAAWSIYVSLAAIIHHPHYYEKFGAGSECLLFRRNDFENAATSYVFEHLIHNSGSEVSALAKTLRQLTISGADKYLPLVASATESLRRPKVLTTFISDDDSRVQDWWTRFLDGNLDDSIEPVLLNRVRVAREKEIDPIGRKILRTMMFAVIGLCGFVLLPITCSIPLAFIMWLVCQVPKSVSQPDRDGVGDLVANGVAVPGVVTVKDPYQNRAKIFYEYPVRLRDGTYAQRCGNVIVSEEESKIVSVGDKLTVLYDANDSWCSVLYCFAGYEAFPVKVSETL